MREKLAALCHEQWSGWMRYLFSKSLPGDDGTLNIPEWAVQRWHKQMTTPYRLLSAEEQESDRKEADRFIEVFEQEAGGVQEGEMSPCPMDSLYLVQAIVHSMRLVEADWGAGRISGVKAQHLANAARKVIDEWQSGVVDNMNLAVKAMEEQAARFDKELGI